MPLKFRVQSFNAPTTQNETLTCSLRDDISGKRQQRAVAGVNKKEKGIRTRLSVADVERRVVIECKF